VLVYTSVTRNYLPKAKVLAHSVKKLHPDWDFAVLLSDVLPEGWDSRDWPFDHVVLLSELGVPEWKSWAFGHSVVELCTAVKGPGALLLIERLQPDKIMYLDPDIRVYGSLAPLERMLDEHAVLLTPHLLDPEHTPAAIVDNEICTLKHGVYNLGFYAATTGGQGRTFVEWWADRLLTYCLADIPGGLFTDQRWCDLAPGFFDRLEIVRDRGYNVATWNVAHRRLTRTPDGTWMAGDVPLRFYHFTGYDSGDGKGMLERYASDQPAAFALWDEYGSALVAAGHGQPRFAAWEYSHFSTGAPITAGMRRLYKLRPDLQQAFPDPYKVEGLHCYYEWWQAEVREGRIEANAATPIPIPPPRPARRRLVDRARRMVATIRRSSVPRRVLAGDRRLLLPGLAIIGAIATVLLSLIGLARHFSPVPSWDMWDSGLNFFMHSTDPRLWWALHNEHPIVLARVLYWVDYRLLGGTGAPLVALNYVMLAIFAVTWITLLRRAPGVTGEQRVAYAALLIAWCFQWMQSGNMIWPFQVQFFLAYLIPLLSFLALGRSVAKVRTPLFHAAAAGGVLSCGTMANGLFVLPLLTTMAASLRLPRRRVIWLTILSCSAWGLYLVGRMAGGGVQSASEGGPAWAFAGYALLFLGSPFYHWAGGGTPGVIIGIGAGLVACAAMVWLTRRVFATAGGPRGVDVALVFFMVYVAASALATAWGRFDAHNLEEAATFRYTTPGIMLWAALFCGLVRSGAGAGLRHGGVTAVLVILAMLALLNRQLDALRWPNGHVHDRAVAGIALSLGVRDDATISVVHPDPEAVGRVAAAARTAGLSIFRHPPFNVAAEIADGRTIEISLPACDGNLDRRTAVGDERFVRLDGWAMTPRGGQATWGRVVDREGRVVGAVIFGGRRSDVEAAHGRAGRLSGFSGYMLRDTGPCSVILMNRDPIARLDAE